MKVITCPVMCVELLDMSAFEKEDKSRSKCYVDITEAQYFFLN